MTICACICSTASSSSSSSTATEAAPTLDGIPVFQNKKKIQVTLPGLALRGGGGGSEMIQNPPAASSRFERSNILRNEKSKQNDENIAPALGFSRAVSAGPSIISNSDFGREKSSSSSGEFVRQTQTYLFGEHGIHESTLYTRA